MKEKVGVVYDSSARGVDIVSILVSRLPLSQEHVRPVSNVSVGWLRSYEVLMLVFVILERYVFFPASGISFFTKNRRLDVFGTDGSSGEHIGTVVGKYCSGIETDIRAGMCAYYFSG